MPFPEAAQGFEFSLRQSAQHLGGLRLLALLCISAEHLSIKPEHTHQASPGWDGQVQGDAQQLWGRQGGSLSRCGSSRELYNALQGLHRPGQALLGLRALPRLGAGLGYADERACQLLARVKMIGCCWVSNAHS